MAFSLHGVKVPHRKNTANTPAVKMASPSTVVIPTAMHIGAPATPVVKPGCCGSAYMHGCRKD